MGCAPGEDLGYLRGVAVLLSEVLTREVHDDVLRPSLMPLPDLVDVRQCSTAGGSITSFKFGKNSACSCWCACKARWDFRTWAEGVFVLSTE